MTQGIGIPNLNLKIKITHTGTHANEREREGASKLTHTYEGDKLITPNPRTPGRQDEPWEDRPGPELGRELSMI